MMAERQGRQVSSPALYLGCSGLKSRSRDRILSLLWGKAQGEGHGPGEVKLLGVSLVDKDPKGVKAWGKRSHLGQTPGQEPRWSKNPGIASHFGNPGSCLVHKRHHR
jgi:hypothetical protein